MLKRTMFVLFTLACAIPVAARGEGDRLTSLINRAPTANPGVSPRIVEAGADVIFNADASSDPDGSIVSATWDFGDGAIEHGVVARHAYAGTGAYIAHLTVRDDHGAFSSAPLTVHVGAQPTMTTQDVNVPTRGGYSIHARITRPNDSARHPVVIRYSIYCVNFVASDEALVRSGYVFIAAEAPGVCSSGGGFDLFGPEVGAAGYDLIEWSATQPWSTGDAGLVGHSGPAITGLAAARAKPPHLRTAVLGSTFGDAYRDAVYPGGVESAVAPEYNAVVIAEPRPGMEPQPRAQGWIGWETSVAENETDNSFWRARSIDEQGLDIPVYWISSWSDLFTRGALEFFHSRGNPASRVAVYPGPHWSFDPTGTMGYRAARDQDVHVGSEERVWLDRWLKHTYTADPRPALGYFLQSGGGVAAAASGKGSWRFVDAWPLPNTTWQPWHLRMDGTASTGSGPDGDMTLSAGSNGATDPRWLDFWGAAVHRAYDGHPFVDAPDGPAGLTWTSRTLSHDLTVAGPITLRFNAALLGTDAAFHATLSDVWPDGSVHVLTSGELRASMHAIDRSRSWLDGTGQIVRPWHPHDSVEPLVPGQSTDYSLELWPVANIFGTGHRLEVGLSLQRAPWYLGPVAPGGTVRHASLLLPVVD